jgi:hypothetical protein
MMFRRDSGSAPSESRGCPCSRRRSVSTSGSRERRPSTADRSHRRSSRGRSCRETAHREPARRGRPESFPRARPRSAGAARHAAQRGRWARRTGRAGASGPAGAPRPTRRCRPARRPPDSRSPSGRPSDPWRRHRPPTSSRPRPLPRARARGGFGGCGRPRSRSMATLPLAPVGLWRSLVARSVRVGEVAGSNPVSPTSHCARTGSDRSAVSGARVAGAFSGVPSRRRSP